MITGINHITIASSDLERSLRFYVNVLGMKLHAKWDKVAYLTAGTAWICLSADSSAPANDYSHIAFDISTTDFVHMQKKCISKNIELWKTNTSEGSSLYILDPDGHKLEIHVGSLQHRLQSLKERPYEGLQLF